VQLNLPMFTVYSGPKFIDADAVAKCKTYREAVQLCYAQRTRRNLSNALIAEECGCNLSHLGDYITTKPRTNARNLPAEFTVPFENSMGNRAISQWQNMRANITILEQLIQAKAA